MLDLQNVAQLKRKRKLIMGAELVTFENTVNAIVRIIQRCGLSGCTQNFFMSFFKYYMQIICRVDYWAEITVIAQSKIISAYHQLRPMKKKKFVSGFLGPKP